MKRFGYLLIVSMLLLAACEKDKTIYTTADPEKRESIVYKDSLPVFKIVLTRKANANITEASGQETVYLGVSPIRSDFDSVRLNIKLKAGDSVIYNLNKTFLSADVASERFFDSIPLQNYLSTIGIYTLQVTPISVAIAEGDTGTFTGFVNVTDSISRYKPFTCVFDSLGKIDIAITGDEYTALKATLYNKTFLIGRLYTAQDSIEIDYITSKLLVSGKKITIDVNFPYVADSVKAIGSLKFEGVKP